MRVVQSVLAALAVTALIAALVYSQRRPEPCRVSGFVESHEIRVGSRVGGRVAEILVAEGDLVSKGQPLARLEPFDLQQRRAEAAAVVAQRKEVHAKLQAGFRPEEISAAQAQVDQQAAVLQKLTAGPRQQEIDVAKAQVELAQAQHERAQLLLNRTEPLVKTGAATPDRLDEVEKDLKVAAAQVQAAKDQLALLVEGTRQEDISAAKAQLAEAVAMYDLKSHGSRAEEIAEAAAAVTASEATLAAFDRKIEELVITAPLDGTIEATDLRPGDLIAADAPGISLISRDDLWVRAYVPENRLNIQIDQIVPITIDSYPGREFKGRITFISRQAEFTPGNIQTPEERSKQVFRIKVMFIDGLDVLRPGMSADVWLDRPEVFR